jgi:transketolase
VRSSFIRTLAELATRDERILLLTGDLGFAAIEPFSERFPERFFNVGVAEQNMVGLATGLAEAGYLPFVYSIATFATLRPYEFIRNGPILQHLPVRIVGIGGGFEYGSAGTTHHALEDIGLMRMQPGLTIMAPADHEQTSNILRKTWDLSGPIYYRLGKDDKTVVPGLLGRFEIGRVQQLIEGSEVLILGMGAVCAEMQAAARELQLRGVSVATAIVASISPAPVDDLADMLQKYPHAFAVESHYTTGGLGSLLCEVVAERGLHCRIHRLGVNGCLETLTGSERYLMQRHGLDAESLAASVLDVTNRR